jgi:hypothetical protein
MIVMAALLIVVPIFPKSAVETLPLKKTTTAPTVAGIASFKPFGRQRTRTTVSKKAIIVNDTMADPNILQSFLLVLF